MERLIHVLLFSGLIQNISCEYVLIQEQKTWDEAQVYCRQNHIDLATVQSIEDWKNVQGAVGPALTSVVWIGFYNDINSWRWSYQDENVTFVGWNSKQPDNTEGAQECTRIESREWYDSFCNHPYPAFCYNEMKTGADRFVFISDVLMSWIDAQSYCRQHHTDLATIRTQAENDLLVKMMEGFSKVWIGLFRDSWKWSDGTNVSMSSINWMSSVRGVSGQDRPCGAVNPAGQIVDQNCLTALPFICRQRSKKQIVRLEMTSGENVNDPVVRETILQWIKQKLKRYGIEKNTILTWRLQEDGNTFTPKHDCAEKNINQEHCSKIYF